MIRFKQKNVNIIATPNKSIKYNWTQADPDALDTDALAFLSQYSINNQSDRIAINSLVLDLKGQGSTNSSVDFWTTFKTYSWANIHPIIGGLSTTHSGNLLFPGTRDLTFFGGVTHDADGIKGNGSNGYYKIYTNTNIIPVDNMTYSVYGVGGALAGGGISGVYNQSTGKQIQHNVRYNTTTFRGYIMSGFARDASDSSPYEGYYSIKTDGVTDGLNVKGTQTNQATYVPGVGNPNSTMTGLALWYSNSNQPFVFSSRYDRWVSMLPHMSDSDELIFKSIIEAYQTALNREA